MDDLLSARAAADLLGCSVESVYKRIRRGELVAAGSGTAGITGPAPQVYRRADVEAIRPLIRRPAARENGFQRADRIRKTRRVSLADDLRARRALEQEGVAAARREWELRFALEMRRGVGPAPGLRLRNGRRVTRAPEAGPESDPVAEYGAGRVCTACGRGGVSRFSEPDPVFGDAVHAACAGLDGSLPAGWRLSPSLRVMIEPGREAQGWRRDWICDWADAGRSAAVKLARQRYGWRPAAAPSGPTESDLALGA